MPSKKIIIGLVIVIIIGFVIWKFGHKPVPTFAAPLNQGV